MSHSCLTPNEQFFSNTMAREQATFDEMMMMPVSAGFLLY
jgi:hypothetical protein